MIGSLIQSSAGKNMSNSYPSKETIHRYELANGIILLVYENFASQSVVIDGALRTGALAESADKAGLASLTAALLMRGTEANDMDTIYEQLESVGASLGVSSGFTTTEFGGGGLVEDIDLLLGLLSDALRRPTFPAEQVERVRGERLTGIQMGENNTRTKAALAFDELVYGDHPYSRPARGTAETVPTLTRDELINFHKENYGPRGMVITIVGAISAEDAYRKVVSTFGNWQVAHQAVLPEMPTCEPVAETIRNVVDMPQKTQTDIIIGVAGPPRAVPDYQDARLANTVLGVFGMMGRLGKNVREKQGLAYYARSSLSGGRGPGPWSASTGVSPDKVNQAIDSIIHEMNRMRDELVPAEELADSQAYLTGSLPVGLETNDGLAGIITSMELNDLGLDYLQNYEAEINAVTPESMQAAARKYLHTDRLVISIAGPDLNSQ